MIVRTICFLLMRGRNVVRKNFVGVFSFSGHSMLATPSALTVRDAPKGARLKGSAEVRRRNWFTTASSASIKEPRSHLRRIDGDRIVDRNRVSFRGTRKSGHTRHRP